MMGQDLDPEFRPPAEFEAPIKAFCERILPVIRQAGRNCGYAVGLHGSMVRDLDLIACPWIEEAASPAELVAAIKAALLVELGGRGAYGGWYPDKVSPHGRMWANFYFQPDVAVETTNGIFPFVDLSIMPRLLPVLTARTRDDLKHTKAVRHTAPEFIRAPLHERSQPLLSDEIGDEDD